MTWLTAMEYLCHKWPRIYGFWLLLWYLQTRPLVVSTSRSFPHSRLITGYVTRLTRLVQIVEQELLTHPEHLSSPPDFSGVRVTRSLVLCVCFADRSLSICTFSFGHCVVCSAIYRFWLPLWYLQTLLMEYLCHKWPRICSTCHSHFPVLSTFMTYHRVGNKIKTKDATTRTGTGHPSGAREVTTDI